MNDSEGRRSDAGSEDASEDASEDVSIRPPSLLALPSYLAGHVARIGHDLVIAVVAEHGLRLPHFAALTALADFGPLPQHVLADRLGLHRSHLVGYLDVVEERGLVRRTRDPGDRRRQLVTLTSEGKRLQRRLLAAVERSQETFLQTLDEAEGEAVIGFLRRILVADDRAHARTGR